MAFHCVRDTRVIVAPFAFLLLSIPVAASPANQESGAISSPSIGAPHVSAVSELAQMTIEQRVIIRVPMVRRAMPRHEDRAQSVYDGREDASEWVERPGPRCVKIKRVTGASIISPRGVDLMLRGDERMRARLGRGWGMTKRRIAFQGELGSNSHEVCVRHFPDYEPAPYPSFEDAFDAISSGECALGAIPVSSVWWSSASTRGADSSGASSGTSVTRASRSAMATPSPASPTTTSGEP